MLEVMFWGFCLRFAQSLTQAAPFIVVGLFIAGVFQRLLGHEGTRRLFGGNTRRSLLQAWGLGMLLPVCSLGVIPAIREMRKVGLAGGTVLAFAMAAPLFNPLSLLYGLTLSEPVAVLSFALCSLVIVTVVGLIWDRVFPHTAVTESPPRPVAAGPKRILAVAVAGLRELAGPSLPYLLIGLAGVAILGAVLPHGSLQRSFNHDNPWAPLTMTALAIPVYATPMVAMSQMGMMFQHANRVGAAFILLTLGAGVNLGTAVWIWKNYGLKRFVTWFALLLVVVIGLAYAVDGPLFPKDVQPADHTHAFDNYCRPWELGDVPDYAVKTWHKLQHDIQPHERIACMILATILVLGIALRVLDRWFVIENWLERPVPEGQGGHGILVASVPGPVLGGIALLGLVAFSIAGCYAYYPPSDEVCEELRIVNTEALSAAMTGDPSAAVYWIERCVDWSRRLEVGVYLRDWELSDYHHWKARLYREKLELLKHEVADNDKEAVYKLTMDLTKTFIRLKRAYLEERPGIDGRVSSR